MDASEQDRMKPIMIVPPDVMSEDDIRQLRENGLCVVVAKDPAAVKFVDPIPSMAQRTKVEAAAIALSRRILDARQFNQQGYIDRSSIARLYVDLLVKGTALDPKQEDEQREYDAARMEEVRKIAREDARAEAAKRKAEKAAQKK
jgi:hypothetical protein